MANWSKDPAVQKKLDDHTRNLRLARTTVVMKEVDLLRINVGPRHAAMEEFRSAFLALGRAKEKLQNA